MGEAEVLLMASPQFLSLGPCFPHLTSGSSLPLQQSVQGELAGKGHCKFFPIRAAPSGSLGQLAPRGAKLICVSKHPPPPKGKAPAQPLGQLLECCSVGQGVFVSTGCPVLSFDFLVSLS